MTDIGDLQAKFERGQAAKGLLEDGTFKELCQDYRDDCWRRFKGDDEDAALEARAQIRFLESFLGKIVKIQKDGTSAQKQIQKLRDREDKG